MESDGGLLRRFFVLRPPSLSVSEDLKLSRNVRVKDNVKFGHKTPSRIKVSKQQQQGYTAIARARPKVNNIDEGQGKRGQRGSEEGGVDGMVHRGR